MSDSAFVQLTRSEALETLVRLALSEDLGPGDVTTRMTVPAEREGRAVIRAKADVVLAGLDPAIRVFEAVDDTLQLRAELRDGSGMREGDVALEIRGRLASILTAERTALNFMGPLSGIATMARAFVREVHGTGARIVDTRKTRPGWRHLEKDAVRAGGGSNHRMGLWDMILIKENHIASAGGITAALDAVRDRDPAIAVEIEVRNLDEFDEALRGAPDCILLDNMSVRDMATAVKKAAALGDARPELEASGNVSLATVRRIAQTGVDLISVGAITHSAPVADLSLVVVE